MNVKMIGYTSPVIEGISNLQEFIAYCARVSNPSNQMNTETSERLIRYCIKNAHWSVFETAFVTLEINTTRDIGRQILRHRSFTFQEFSQRYADPTQMEFQIREARLQDLKNRQNSISFDDDDLKHDWNILQESVWGEAMSAYRWAINNGIAKEQARAVLPEGITMTRMYMTGSLRSWITYIQLRTDKATQKEHREIATQCAEAIEPVFPMIKEFVNE